MGVVCSFIHSFTGGDPCLVFLVVVLHIHWWVVSESRLAIGPHLEQRRIAFLSTFLLKEMCYFLRGLARMDWFVWMFVSVRFFGSYGNCWFVWRVGISFFITLMTKKMA